jgi:Acetyltransferases, including N-acetylases of ribosomal proteins
MKIQFKQVEKGDAEFLLELLTEREGHVNISHKSTPSWEEHVKFIESKPYAHWDLIFCDNEKIGNIYLTDRDEIGIFILKKFQSKGYGSMALNEFLKKTGKKRFLANINPTNYKSIQFFGKNGFSHIISTYQKKNNDDE